jgi:hypothetical protein
MNYLKLIFLILSIAISESLFAQNTLKGRVIDSETGKPLPFVNIVYNQRGQGFTTSINGSFEFTTYETITQLQTSYIGYEPKKVRVASESFVSFLTIELNPTSYNIEEVVVKPGINPAHRLIDSVYANRTRNNPENLKSFRYTSYNKLTFRREPDTAYFRSILSKSVPDSVKSALIEQRVRNFEKNREKRPDIITESVTNRFYKKPNSNYEEVLATRMSGYSEAYAVLLATQIQSFSFYPEYFTLFQKTFLNPISRSSHNHYSFILEEKYLSESGRDTVFVITFRPRKNSNFDGLKGVMYINSNGYAVQNVLAQPAKPMDLTFNGEIQQRYELIDGKQWFPTELNLSIKIYTARSGLAPTNPKKLPIYLLGTGRTYINNIVINPNVDSVKFSHVELTMNPEMHKRSAEFWNQYRTDSLTLHEKKSYKTLDSLGKAANLDFINKLAISAFSGKLDLGYVAVDISKLVNYNRFEGYRLGLGLETGSKISKTFALGGYAAYGFDDAKAKYGAHASVWLNKKYEVQFKAAYQFDIREPGSFDFSGSRAIANPDYIYSFYNNKLDYVEKKSAQLSFRSLKYLHTTLFASQSNFEVGSDFRYVPQPGDTTNNFSNFETGVKLRIVWNEKFAQSPWGIMPLTIGNPMVWLNYAKGIKEFGGEFDYHRVELRYRQRISSPMLGQTQITACAGQVFGTAPLSLLYFGRGMADMSYLFGIESFNTMDRYSFVANRIVNIFLTHNFRPFSSKLNGKMSNPSLTIVQKFAIGSFSKKSMHGGNIENLKSLSRGYWESSIQINDLLKIAFSGLGIGVSYNTGYYSSKTWKDNLAISLTVNFIFQQ